MTRDRGVARAVESLDRLHPTALAGAPEIRDLLERVLREGLSLRRGMNRRIDPETAQIESIGPDGMVVRTQHFDPTQREAVFLNFALEDQPYFFSAPFQRDLGKGRLELGLPPAIYRAERRGRVRRAPGEGETHRVSLQWDAGGTAEGEVEDASPEGMSVSMEDGAIAGLEALVRVRLLDGANAGSEVYGEVCNRAPVSERKGWTRIGLDLSPAPRAEGLRVERREQVLSTTTAQRAQRRWKIASAGLRVATDRALTVLGRRATLPSVRIVDYENEKGENLRAIVDSWGLTRGATAVVIPPAWGRTKETLMPLAATIVAGFRAAGEPIVVLRFDGIRKRGESFNDPTCREPGTEHHRFTFSQGVRDIRTTLDFLEKSAEFQPRKTVLVSFSAASIESRRAVATDPRIDGWVCAVGAADTQSMMKVISGGIDYVSGLERGVSFGIQEILGVAVDIDHAGVDLFANELSYLDDARRDFVKIRVPVTWVHGIHDAWMNADRAKDALARGDTSNRKFLEVPTGHMLKSSREAIETFQLIAAEVSAMALGRPCPQAIPDLGALGRRQNAERRRLSKGPSEDLREFWRKYLVGTDGKLGIELMTHVRPYRDLMREQVEALSLRPGHRIADLGSGTGALPLYLSKSGTADEVEVLEMDYVRDGFSRARVRLSRASRPIVAYVESNLDLSRRLSIPIAAESVDAVLAGFFLSYVADPAHVLKEMRRILRPGGRLVLTSLRRDADISKLYTEGIAEIRATGHDLQLGSEDFDVELSARSYLNQASKLLDLEEAGRFHFWDLKELEKLIRSAGFTTVSGVPTFGDPPQAILVSADRR